jgi:hypothetical protein
MKLCRGCGRPVTGQQALAALGRMVEAGLTVQEAKALSPSCFHCARRVGTASRSEETVKQEMSYATNR